ncbi:hypothetical protein P3X46_019679 [Hevea brasiliensis]|uniref:Pectinesterase n=1 Tax=Hevea brasiliensis TaxID=3981 RepID=A0ABQ9LLH3_HEVBR|nr:pectinesterase [Hevea brasiliensis]KAJ9168117.1 hypothetical protein P3X46_019679 [Hevea brasiliensis]
MKEDFPPLSNSSNGITSSKNKNKKRLFLGLFASVLLVTAVISIIAGVASRRKSSANAIIEHDHQAAHAILKSSCSATLYPDLCFSAISTLPDASSKIKNTKDVIDLSLNLSKTSVERTYLKIKKLTFRQSNFTKREKTALSDCLEMLNETLDEIKKALQDLRSYPSLKKSLAEHADDLKILLSAAMTNQETCVEGFYYEKADEKVRKLFLSDEKHAHHLCSNTLAMIKNMTDADMAKEKHLASSSSGRKLEEENGIEWPQWMSAGDRRLLQARDVTPNVVVAADGSGNYQTVGEAVAAAPAGSSSRYIIRIKAGAYRENVEVPSRKTNIMFVGDGRTTTVITGNRNVVDGSTTFRSATVAVVGDGFMARDITFQNTAGPSKHQAVALRVGSDQSAFYRCDMLAYQDTLYVHTLRQFYVSCIIVGSVDFIFGNAAAVFQNCDIHARRPNPGQRNMVTAQGREDPNQNTGIAIQNCRIGATQDLQAAKGSFQSYLGRPWKQYSRTVIMRTDISDIINPAGWHEWDGDFALDTLFYREYQNTGAGANTANRVTWKGFKVMTSASEALPFTAENFVGGSKWLPSTGFPYLLGL